MDWRPYIVIDSNLRFGKPCIKGTRIAVEDVLGWLEAGVAQSEILEDFPQLKPSDIQAALAYASEIVAQQPTTKSA